MIKKTFQEQSYLREGSGCSCGGQRKRAAADIACIDSVCKKCTSENPRATVKSKMPCIRYHTHITRKEVGCASMHVELASSRREAVEVSGRWSRATARSGKELRPVHGGGVERVQVVEFKSNCRRQEKAGAMRVTTMSQRGGYWESQRHSALWLVRCIGGKVFLALALASCARGDVRCGAA
jgi:hypothetical protein